MSKLLGSDPAQAQSWRQFRKEIEVADTAGKAALLAERARLTRRDVVETISTAGQGHIGGDLSVTDILTTLYGAVLHLDPQNPDWAERDRLVLSKGHCAVALYSTLAETGYFPRGELSTFMAPGSALNGHPNRNKVPGVETNTGPLGHGLPFAVGAAAAARLAGKPYRVFVVLGDGEMQEGSNWEALMSAAHQKLDNLTVIVDRNRLQQGARTEETNALDPFDDKLVAFGLEVRSVDGHDYNELLNAFEPSRTGKPVGVIANTTKGKGVSFIEDRAEWHHKVPNPQQVTDALKELA